MNGFKARYEKLGCECPPWTRFLVLFFLCFNGFCGLLMYDIPGSLQNAIMQRYNLSEFQFSLLYSLYSWPSVVVCFFGGFLIDKWLGLRLAAVIFGVFQLAGVGLFITGGFFECLWLMLVGRFTFGIGGEMSGVCVNMYVLTWFKGKELNMVFALIQNTLRLGTSGVYLISTPLLAALSKTLNPVEALNFTLLILCSAAFFPLVHAIILMLMKQKQTGVTDLKHQESTAASNDVKASDIKKLPLTFWILCISVNLYYHTLYTFLAFTQQFFTQKFSLSDTSANQVSSLFNIIPIVLATLVGIVVDRVARNMIFMLSAVILAIAAHSLAAFFFSPYLIIITFSISNSLMLGSYLPTIAYTVDSAYQGTAYGINQSVSNLLSSFGAMIAGWIIYDFGYLNVEMYYLICLTIVLGILILLLRLDKKRKNVLNMSSSRRLLYEESL